MNMNPRASALMKTLKAFQAVMLSLAVFTILIPAGAIPVRAEVATDTPAVTDPAPLNCENGQVPNADNTACVDPAPVVPTCENGQVLNDAGDACVDPAPVTPTCTDGQVLSDDGTACVDDTSDQGAPQSFARFAAVVDDNSCVAVSDGDTDANGNPAVPTYVHPNWNHTLEGDHGATWIWDTADVADPAVDHTVTFTKEMDVVSATTANLEIASDNEYTVTVNAAPASCDGSQADNFSNVESCSINLNAGANTIVFTVKNDAVSGETNPHSNPAGLIYKITADNEVACGLPKEEPKNSCVAPTGSEDAITFGHSGEDTLQKVLDDAGFSINATDDQTNTQTWDGTNNTVNFTAKFIKHLAGYNHVFGYYTNGNLATFTPIYSDGSVPAPYNGVTVASPNQTFNFSVPAVTAPGVGFAIKAYSGSTLIGTWATQKSVNSDGNDHAVVYNSDDDQYVVAFDDQTGNSVDHDYNDIVTEVDVDGCTDAPTCNADTELLQNGSFETPVVTNGALWDVFATGAPGLAWVATWLNPSGAPTLANAELQKQGLNGWNAKVGDGTQWAELDSDWGGPSSSQTGEAGQVALTQTINTIVGKTYTFSFDFSPRPGTAAAENKVEAVAGGVVIGSAGPTAGGANTSWTSQSFSFVATTTSTVVGLRDAGTPNDSLGTFVDNASIRCTPTHETPHQATIVASKIVCTDESQLPNYGLGGHGPITATTAADWVANHNTCHLEDGWNFEVADQTGGDAGGSFIGAAGAPYVPFGPTVAGTATKVVSTTGVNSFHVREQLKDGYIPFTYDSAHQSDANNVSAELYCSNDVLHYDNYDFINNPVDGATYYCVAWNVPKAEQCNPEATETILSSDQGEGELILGVQDPAGAAKLVASPHGNWFVPGLTDGKWVWYQTSTNATDAVDGVTKTFYRDFTITGTPHNSTLSIASDNGIVVKVNGIEVLNDQDEHNYEATQTVNIPAADLQSGMNEITFTVTNMALEGGTPDNNPAGLSFKLTVNNDECTPNIDVCSNIGGTQSQVPEGYEANDGVCTPIDNGGGDDDATLTIVKNAEGGDGTFSFQVVGGNDFSTSTQITTEEGGGSKDIELKAGDYDVNELNQQGWTLQHVSCVYDNKSVGSPIAGGEEISVDDGDHVTCTFTNTKDGEETNTDETIVVRLADLFSGTIFDGLTSGKWFMYNDTTDAIDNTLGSFVTGPATAPAGDGSIEFTLGDAPNDRKDIATYQFQGTPLANIKTLEFSAFSNANGSGSGANESPYLVFNVDFTGVSGAYQSRLVYVPQNNGSVPQGQWNSFDAIDGGNAEWVYSGATWPVTGQPGTTMKTWNQILADYPSARLLPLGGLMGVRVGEPGPTPYTGDVDAFIIGIKTGTNTDTVAYDFEPDAAVTPNDVVHHSSSRRNGSGGGNTGGEVLGASTCGPLITDYLKLGWNNNADQVKALQGFLNSQLGLTLPLSGLFGPLTFDAVKAFQVAHGADVLTPWASIPGSGISGANTPTGFVYQTTKWEINNIWCPGSEAFPAQLN